MFGRRTLPALIWTGSISSLGSYRGWIKVWKLGHMREGTRAIILQRVQPTLTNEEYYLEIHSDSLERNSIQRHWASTSSLPVKALLKSRFLPPDSKRMLSRHPPAWLASTSKSRTTSFQSPSRIPHWSLSKSKPHASRGTDDEESDIGSLIPFIIQNYTNQNENCMLRRTRQLFLGVGWKWGTDSLWRAGGMTEMWISVNDEGRSHR